MPAHIGRLKSFSGGIEKHLTEERVEGMLYVNRGSFWNLKDHSAFRLDLIPGAISVWCYYTIISVLMGNDRSSISSYCCRKYLSSSSGTYLSLLLILLYNILEVSSLMAYGASLAKKTHPHDSCQAGSQALSSSFNILASFTRVAVSEYQKPKL